MNTRRELLIIIAVILLAGLSANAAAQTIARPIPIETTVYLKVNAIEVGEGVVGLDPKFGESVFGYGFLGQTTGDLPGSFMLSMNCAPATFIAGESNSVTGGTWTLPIYMRSYKGFNVVYMGSLYGQIASGKMAWAKEGGAEVFINLTVDGGAQTWAGAKGYGTFQGALTVDEKGAETFSGELTITYTQ